MSKIFDLAAQLGQELKEDERLVRLKAAREAYDGNEELQALIAEYNAQQAAIEQAAGAEEIDTHLIDILQERVNEIYAAITQGEVYLNLQRAQQEVNALMEAVNSTISFNITGELPSSCTHNCSTCGGGCH
ncbi:MAG: YlbF family regulator [Clostridia bacterium]|nr:YlbF family regulator [Clostridia bacterium]